MVADERDADHGPALVRLAAMARIVESLSAGDVRVLASELRAGLEALTGPGAEVVPIKRPAK